MPFRTWVLFLLSNTLIVVLFLGLTFYAVKVNADRNAATVEALEQRIGQVVIKTLKTVREDVSLLGSSAPVKASEEPVGDDKKLPQLEGVDNLSIIGDEFFLDGRRFSAGQCVYPWGICIAVLPTSVVFIGMDGGTTIVCKAGRSMSVDDLSKPEQARGDKGAKSADPLLGVAG